MREDLPTNASIHAAATTRAPNGRVGTSHVAGLAASPVSAVAASVPKERARRTAERRGWGADSRWCAGANAARAARADSVACAATPKGTAARAPPCGAIAATADADARAANSANPAMMRFARLRPLTIATPSLLGMYWLARQPSRCSASQRLTPNGGEDINRKWRLRVLRVMYARAAICVALGCVAQLATTVHEHPVAAAQCVILA